MMPAIKIFLTGLFQDLLLPDGVTAPYLPADTLTVNDLGTIFFGDLPRDFLKDHDFAVQCLVLRDQKKRDGRLIGRQRNLEATNYTFTRRRYRREIMVRCLFWAARSADLEGEDDYIGLIDQFEQAVIKTRVLADGGNNAIRVELQDSVVRPWDGEITTDRQKRRPYLALVRLEFIGGRHTLETVPIIQSVEITPAVG